VTTTFPVMPPASPAHTADLDERLHRVLQRLADADSTNIGYPRASDIDYRPFAPFLKYMINNCGGPSADSIYPAHAMDVERDVLAWHARLFRGAPGWTGYLTTGGTEANIYSLWLARTKFPNAVLYVSTAAHYSINKAAHLLSLPTAPVVAAPHGELDYADLRNQAGRHRSRPAIVVATIGTTMAQATDSVPRIHQALDAAGITHRWVHADAALAGVPLTHTGRDDFDLAPGGADSLMVTGHKWWGTPLPVGVALARRRPSQHPDASVSYIGSRDTTLAGSRSGLTALMVWHAISQFGPDGHRQRAERAQAVAEYACRRLASIGWPCWRNDGAITVMLRPLPDPLRQRWPMPVEGPRPWSRFICMPGVTTDHVDALVDDLKGV
jgi:histidine decarboxylase